MSNPFDVIEKIDMRPTREIQPAERAHEFWYGIFLLVGYLSHQQRVRGEGHARW